MPSVYIKTYGCSTNQADSETMAGLLQQANYALADSPEEADVVLVNTCTVKDATENTFFKDLSNLPKKPTVIAGCIAQAQPESLKGHTLLGTEQLHNVVSVVEGLRSGKKQVALEQQKEAPRLLLPKVRKNPLIEIIAISKGCTSYCTYCETKKARGDLVSFRIRDIVAEAQKAIDEGVKEIWLTSQDNGAYGLDINTNFAELIQKVASLEGDFMIRAGMANPDHIKKQTKELIEAFKHPKVFKFLHIPVQAGNNDVLKRMARLYTVEEFKDIVEQFRKELPDITIATDIICGFPTETDEQFKDTVDLIYEVKPEVMNISRYSARPGTPAANMKQLPGGVIKDRSREMTVAHEETARNQNSTWLGWEGEVIIDEKGKDNSWKGRNSSYKQIIVKGNHQVGEKLHVKIVETRNFDLVGEPL